MLWSMFTISAITASMAACPLRGVVGPQLDHDARAHDAVVDALDPFGMHRHREQRNEHAQDERPFDFPLSIDHFFV